VYGVSTAGSIAGTLGTTFLLIPTLGARAITLMLGVIGVITGAALLLLSRLSYNNWRSGSGARRSLAPSQNE